MKNIVKIRLYSPQVILWAMGLAVLILVLSVLLAFLLNEYYGRRLSRWYQRLTLVPSAPPREEVEMTPLGCARPKRIAPLAPVRGQVATAPPFPSHRK